ncbi:MAG: hypothetical protein MZW92_65505 [Comamonadaceae bacterium]|nr:hypothetical protein [Comamonadaceae bacterium]
MAEIYGPDLRRAASSVAQAGARGVRRHAGHRRRRRQPSRRDARGWCVRVDRQKAALLGVSADGRRRRRWRMGLGGDERHATCTAAAPSTRFRCASNSDVPDTGRPRRACSTLRLRAAAAASWCRCPNWSRSCERSAETARSTTRTCCRVVFVTARHRSASSTARCTACSTCVGGAQGPGARRGRHAGASASSASRTIPTGCSLKWDGEWQITYETFRDMGLAYAVGLILIYLLVVAQFELLRSCRWSSWRRFRSPSSA